MSGPNPPFDVLVAEATSVPIVGWDFSWLEGRATEQRPSWGYAGMLVSRLGRASSVLDIQTGGGEVFSQVLDAAGPPALVAATESWPPNVAVARQKLAPVGGTVAEVADEADLPFEDATFQLVVSRHPTTVVWPEIARVLRPGGTYLSQQVGAGTNRELTDFMMGSQPVSGQRSPERARAKAGSVGLEVIDLRAETLEVRFFDVGAVIYFLRLVLWTVPDFSIERYRDRLRAMHDHIAEKGSFVSHSERFLIEARKP